MADLYHPDTKASVTVPDRSAASLKRNGWTDKSDQRPKSRAQAPEAAPAAETAPEGAQPTPNEGAQS